MSEKLKEQTGRPAPKRARSAQLLAFPGLKRPRGRPRKDRTDRSAPESFEILVAVLKACTAGKEAWHRAAERQRREMERARARQTTIAVVDFMTFRFNRSKGMDWRTAATIADELGVTTRSVERAFEEGECLGVIKRRREGRNWQTTLPRMYALAMEAQRDLDEFEARASPTGNATKPDRKIGSPTGKSLQPIKNSEARPDPTKKSLEPDQKVAQYPTKKSRRILIRNPKEESSPRACAREGDDFSKPELKKGASPAAAAPASAIAPRYNTALPLRQRIRIWRFGAPDTAEDQAILREMRQAAKGWSLDWCLDQFCGFAADDPEFEAPHDAVKAFLGYMRRKITKPATGWTDLSATPRGAKKKSAHLRDARVRSGGDATLPRQPEGRGGRGEAGLGRADPRAADRRRLGGVPASKDGEVTDGGRDG